VDTPPGYVLMTFAPGYVAADANLAKAICGRAGWVLIPRFTNPFSMFTRCDVETARSDAFLVPLRGVPHATLQVSIRDSGLEEPPITGWRPKFITDGHGETDLAYACDILQRFDLGGIIEGMYPPTLKVSTWDIAPGHLNVEEVTQALGTVPHTVLEVTQNHGPVTQWRVGELPIYQESDGQPPAVVWHRD
jgi:hypothetical protein